MATYEYICLACETSFEERRSMTATVDTAIACPSCSSDRVRRRFSLFATGSGSATSVTEPGPVSFGRAGGCACGGACACGGH